MVLNYLQVDSPIFTAAVKLSLVITVVSSLHYIVHAARIINGPEERG